MAETNNEVGGGRNDEFKTTQVYSELSVEAAEPVDFPTKIEKSDIKAHPIKQGETEIVLQRHGAYIRDREDPNVGSLSEESAATEKTAAKSYFEAFLDSVPEGERDRVEVLIVASDTQYFDGGKRSYETATLAQEAAQEVFESRSLPSANIINTTGRLSGEGGPRPMPKLREPNFLNESPDFLDYMLTKYGGVNLDFWIAFEEDRHKETRLAMEAEGPDDIANRTAFTIRVLARYADGFHRANPDSRLVIWGATHYDTISPFVKRDLFGIDKDKQLMVDYGAGISIDIDTTGRATTELGGKQYDVPLKKSTSKTETE
jgi:hypothetical protein